MSSARVSMVCVWGISKSWLESPRLTVLICKCSSQHDDDEAILILYNFHARTIKKADADPSIEYCEISLKSIYILWMIKKSLYVLYFLPLLRGLKSLYVILPFVNSIISFWKMKMRLKIISPSVSTMDNLYIIYIRITFIYLSLLPLPCPPAFRPIVVHIS